MGIAASRRACWIIAAVGFVVAEAQSGPGKASIISSSPSLPLVGVPYVAMGAGAGCFPTANICISQGRLIQTSVVSSTFNIDGQDIVTNAAFDGTLTTLGGTPLGPISLTGTVEEEVEGRTFSTETGSFTTDLTDLSLIGPLSGNTLTVTLDGSNPSAGMTTITPTSGEYRIDSFFDVFVDLTLDQVPPLAASVGPIRLIAVPEPATWAMMLIGFAGLCAGYRRRAGAA
jgi:hypothetical protein